MFSTLFCSGTPHPGLLPQGERESRRASFTTCTSPDGTTRFSWLLSKVCSCFAPSSSQPSPPSGGRGSQAFPFLAAFVLGLLTALAFPPFHAVPLLLVTFPALAMLIRQTRTGGGAFGLGWLFAFGEMGVSFHWIAGALFVDIRQFWWVLPLAVMGLPALLALVYGAATAAAKRLGVEGTRGTLTLALVWFAAEESRAHLVTGFPWDLLGYVWSGVLPVLQTTSLIGIEGLTFLTILAAFAPAALSPWRRRGDNPTLPSSRRSGVALVGLGALLLGGLAVWGVVRLQLAPLPNENVVPGARLRLVQPGTEQALKWVPGQREANLDSLVVLSVTSPVGTPPTHILWPETATAFYLMEMPEVRARIMDRLRAVAPSAYLLTGAVRHRFPNELSAVAAPSRLERPTYTNALLVLDPHGNVVGAYDKAHLVPFGEYIPFRAFLPVWATSAVGMDFTAGEGPRTLRVPGVPPFSPLVCYEAIFAGAALDPEDRPGWLLNVTNDAWYHGTIGPAQHWAMAAARAVEEGVPLVRVANEGFTGIVDPWGRVTARIGPESPAVLDADLPRALAVPTLFERGGRWAPLILGGALALGLALARGLQGRARRGVKL